MRVMCIDIENAIYMEHSLMHQLTIGKIYEVDVEAKNDWPSSSDYLPIIDDHVVVLHRKELFIPLEEYRANQIDKII